jgi:hypothetical protein
MFREVKRGSVVLGVSVVWVVSVSFCVADDDDDGGGDGDGEFEMRDIEER